MVNKNNAVAVSDAAQPPPAASASPTDVTDKKGDKVSDKYQVFTISLNFRFNFQFSSWEYTSRKPKSNAI